MDWALIRARFLVPAGRAYLAGHSLGPMARSSHGAVSRLLAQWRDAGVGGWGEGAEGSWLDMASSAAARLARLVGAQPAEIAVCDSVSLNLYKLASHALDRAGRARRLILIGADEFPTDRWVIEGLARARGLSVAEVPPTAFCDRMGTGEAALAVLSLVHWRTAELADGPGLTAAARQSGTALIWDLSHATGAVAVDLAGWGAEFAVGCGYKYLNGGPGAPGFAFVAQALHATLDTPVRGWMGASDPLGFAGGYSPAAGAARLAAGTPPMLSLAALDAALAEADAVGTAALATRAAALRQRFLERLEHAGLGSLVAGARRGGAHLLLRHAQAAALRDRLAADGVVCDHRPPDGLRLGFSPMILSEDAVDSATDALRAALRDGGWRSPADGSARSPNG